MLLKDALPITVGGDGHLLNLLHVLLAHESEAELEYSQIIEGLTDRPEVKTILEEIRKDERNHMGRLLECIALLDPIEIKEIMEEENAD